MEMEERKRIFRQMDKIQYITASHKIMQERTIYDTGAAACVCAYKMERARSFVLLVQTQKPINLLYRIKANGKKRTNYFRLMPLLFSHCIYKRISRPYARHIYHSQLLIHLFYLVETYRIYEDHIIISTWNSISCCA